MSNKFLTRGALRERVGLSYSTVWRLERRGLFPARRRLSPGRVGWLESEINAWVTARETCDALTIRGQK